MSKTYELLERVATDEFKAQTLEANSNIYLTAYSFIIGVLFLHIEEIYSAFQLNYRNSQTVFYVALSNLFTVALLAGTFLFLMQCLRARLPKADHFAPSLDVCRYESEERIGLLAGDVAYKYPQSEKIDAILADIIRLRSIAKVNEVNKELQKYNKNKRRLQRFTGFFLMFAAFVGGYAIVHALPLRPNGTPTPATQTSEVTVAQ